MDWITILSGIIGAILGALISGVVSFLINKSNQKEQRKTKKEELYRSAHKDRPEFKIESYISVREFHDEDVKDLNLLFLPIEGFDGTFMEYPEEVKKKDLIEIIYKIKNVGNTDISELWISTNYPRQTAIFDYNYFKFVCDNKSYLSYKACYDTIIRKEDAIEIKFICAKNKMIRGMFSSAAVIWFCYVNDVWWSQPLFFPDNKIYMSRMEKYSDFKKQTSEDMGLECFRNPHLW